MTTIGKKRIVDDECCFGLCSKCKVLQHCVKKIISNGSSLEVETRLFDLSSSDLVFWEWLTVAGTRWFLSFHYRCCGLSIRCPTVLTFLSMWSNVWCRLFLTSQWLKHIVDCCSSLLIHCFGHTSVYFSLPSLLEVYHSLKINSSQWCMHIHKKNIKISLKRNHIICIPVCWFSCRYQHEITVGHNCLFIFCSLVALVMNGRWLKPLKIFRGKVYLCSVNKMYWDKYLSQKWGKVGVNISLSKGVGWSP